MAVAGVTPRSAGWAPGLADESGSLQYAQPVLLPENLLNGLNRWHRQQGAYSSVALFRRPIMRDSAREEALLRDGAEGGPQVTEGGLDLVLEPGGAGIAVSDPEAAVHAIANRAEGLDGPWPDVAVPVLLSAGRADRRRGLGPASPPTDNIEGSDGRDLIGDRVRVQFYVGRPW